MTEGREIQQPFEARILDWKNKYDEWSDKMLNSEEGVHHAEYDELMEGIYSEDTAQAVACYETLWGGSEDVSTIGIIARGTENQEFIDLLIERLEPAEGIEHAYIMFKEGEPAYTADELSRIIENYRKHFKDLETKVSGDVLKTLRKKRAQFENYLYNVGLKKEASSVELTIED
jgi:hypothetical protein